MKNKEKALGKKWTAAAKENEVVIVNEETRKKFMAVNLNLPLIDGENIFILFFVLKKKSFPSYYQFPSYCQLSSYCQFPNYCQNSFLVLKLILVIYQ